MFYIEKIKYTENDFFRLWLKNIYYKYSETFRSRVKLNRSEFTFKVIVARNVLFCSLILCICIYKLGMGEII